MAGSRKPSSPQSSSRRIRALPKPSEDRSSGQKPHRSKRKLSFEQATEQTTQKNTEHQTEQSAGKNILNLPYSDSESEQQIQYPAVKSSEQSAECPRNYQTFSQAEQGESSKTLGQTNLKRSNI
jgi:hypothetical protein